MAEHGIGGVRRPPAGAVLVRIAVEHNMLGAMGIRPEAQEAPLAYARRVRPNAVEAVALFQSDWEDREVTAPLRGVLHVTVQLDHVDTGGPDTRLRRAPDGWRALIRLDRRALMRDGRERCIGEIVDALDIQMQDLLGQVAPVPPLVWHSRRVPRA